MTLPPNFTVGVRRGARFLDFVLIVGFGIVLVAALFPGLTVHRWGWGVLDRSLSAVALATILRVLLMHLTNPLGFKGASSMASLLRAAMVGAGMICLWFALTQGFRTALERHIRTNAAYSGESPSTIRANLSRSRNGYPDERFVQDILRTVPEEASILYFGDQRAHVLTYMVYPRKLYMLPELQKLQLKAAQVRAEEWEDPCYRGVDWPPAAIDPEEACREAAGLIAEKKIEWAVFYDWLEPEKSRVWRIGS